MGFEAVRMVLSLIDDPARDVQQVTLPTRLVERGSCRRLTEHA
jgi:DNA-binding LacI/PurR family transcriptional regulator